MAVKTPHVNLGKTFLLILGAATLGVGLYSHFDSIWIKPTASGEKLYKACNLTRHEDAVKNDKICPEITSEIYFVTAIISCYVITCVDYLIGLKIDFGKSYRWKMIDLGFHVIIALLLLVAGTLYILSAVQIKYLLDPDGQFHGEFLFYWKISAGVLTVVQSVVYGLIAYQIWKYNRMFY